VINNDRIAGFEKALADINDENRPKGTIREYATQSRMELKSPEFGWAGWPNTINTDFSYWGILVFVLHKSIYLKH
jgi:hypothetical protein